MYVTDSSAVQGYTFSLEKCPNNLIKYAKWQIIIGMRITGTHRARSDGTPCKGNLLLAPQQGVAAAWVLLLVVHLGLERAKA